MAPKEVESPSSLALQPHMWIFGYGSIIWKQGFEFSHKKVGFIKGFVRRFWQGCISHRGVEGAPGRVATLVKEDEGVTWGVAFQLIGQEQIYNALEHLNMRETTLGGYDLQSLTFHAKDGTTETVLLYIATPENSNYKGPEDVEDIAHSVAYCRGKAGPNTEYLFKLVDFMKEKLPEVVDEHLYRLEEETKKLLLSNKMFNGWKSMMLNRKVKSPQAHIGRWQLVRENLHHVPLVMY